MDVLLIAIGLFVLTLAHLIQTKEVITLEKRFEKLEKACVEDSTVQDVKIDLLEEKLSALEKHLNMEFKHEVKETKGYVEREGTGVDLLESMFLHDLFNEMKSHKVNKSKSKGKAKRK